VPTTIFLDFNLPNATTWFYFSVLLAIALFFQFSRVLSLRNWDLLALFALAPGLLFVQEGHDRRREARQLGDAAARLHILPDADGGAALAAAVLDGPARQRAAVAQRQLSVGYQWLFVASCYWILRCLLDLVFIRRPGLQPNMTTGALGWFALSLFLSIGAVALRRPPPDEGRIGPPGAVLQEATDRAEQVIRQTSGETDRNLVRWWVERTLAGLCHFAVICLLVQIGYVHFGSLASGMAAAVAYLVLPYLAFHMNQVHHVLPTALLLGAVAGYRDPRVAGVCVGLSAGAFGFPVLVAPVWMSFYRGRGIGRFLVCFLIAAGFALGIAGFALWLNGRFDLQIPTTIGLPQWRKWRVIEAPNSEGFWVGVYWAYRIPVFIAATAFVLVTAIWPQPKDLGNVIALSSAHLLAVQLWYADRGGVYVLWYLPLVILMVFRPSLYDRLPPARASET
jgi:hypothetical protein